MENLLNFPQSTFVDKLIPKAKFVKASDTPTAMRDLLTEEFEQIRLMYVLRADTLNIEPGNDVKEIDVLFLKVKSEKLKVKSWNISPFKIQLLKLDLLIPRHTLYIIVHGGSFDLLMQHKRRTVVAGLPKWTHDVSLLQQDVDINTFGLRIEGMNLDRVYFNLLSQMSGYRVDDSESLTQIKALEDEIAKKRHQVEVLQKKVRTEKQFNLQVELNSQPRSIRKEINQLEKRLSSFKTH